MRLSRVGFDHVLGYLKDGIEAWKEAGFETDSIHTISPSAFANKLNAKSIVVDARKPSEYEAEHVENAINIPLDTINENFQSIPKGDDFFLHCAGGYRSVIMASILKSRGIHNLINLEKVLKGIQQTSVCCSKLVCTSTKK
jgi:rhodanese-related sulfurtransferase